MYKDIFDTFLDITWVEFTIVRLEQGLVVELLIKPLCMYFSTILTLN